MKKKHLSNRLVYETYLFSSYVQFFYKFEMDESVSTMEQKQQRPKLNSDDEQEKENQSRISRIYERALDG